MGNGVATKFKKLYQAIYEFLTEKWIETQEEGQISRLHRYGHFWLLVFKSFSRNKCPLRATALAYSTLLALIPLLAVVVSVTTSVLKQEGEEGTRKLITQFVDKAVLQLKLIPQDPGQAINTQQEVVNKIYEYINKVNESSKTLGVTGIIGLILVGILLLSSIEDTFNDIWGITRGRSWLLRIVYYWATISLGPIVLALLITHVGTVFLGSANHVNGFFGYLLQLLPSFFLVSIAFALLYKLMPNTPVHWLGAINGGVVGGSLWLLLNIFNAFNLSKVASLNTTFGPLAVVPIFLIGLYFSWLIVLFGSQVAYAFQNRATYVQTKKAETVNERGREYVALRVMNFLGQRFAQSQPPATLLQISSSLGVPSRLIVLVVEPLIQAGLVLELTSDAQVAYAPARPLDAINCQDIIQTFRGARQDLETRDDAARMPVCAAFTQILEAERNTASSITLMDLVKKTLENQKRES
jgi:membrane protein